LLLVLYLFAIMLVFMNNIFWLLYLLSRLDMLLSNIALFTIWLLNHNLYWLDVCDILGLFLVRLNLDNVRSSLLWMCLLINLIFYTFRFNMGLDMIITLDYCFFILMDLILNMLYSSLLNHRLLIWLFNSNVLYLLLLI
jgi:hypothetical protein